MNASVKPKDQTERRGSRTRKDLLLIVVFLFFLLILFEPLLAIGLGENPTAMTGEGSILRQLNYLLAAGLILFALKPLENYQRLLAIPLPLLIGLAYCWLSLIWAIEPMIAMRRLLLTSLIMWIVFASLRQLKFGEVIFILRWATAIVLVVNYVTVLAFPAYGIHQGNAFGEMSLAGDWRGILQHKNLAGVTCAFTLIIFAFDRGKMPRWLQIAVIVAATYFLYQSNSKTSFGLGLGAIAIGFVFLRYKWKYRGVILIALCLLAITATVLSGMYQNPLLQKLDDPTAFTGRTMIWQALLSYIAEHPFLGSGYGSFWNIGASSPIYSYASGELTEVPNGHNGFLDLAAQLGLPGLALIVCVAVIYPLNKLLVSPLVTGQRGAMLIGLFLFCVGHNATESTLFDRDMLVWVMFMTSMALSQPDLIVYEREKFNVHNLVRIRRKRRRSSVPAERTLSRAGR